MKIKFAIIVAVDRDLGIGKNGALPWSLPGEIKYFKEITTAPASGRPNVVIMGRRTWESIPAKFRPLSNRINIVLTRHSAGDFPTGVYSSPSLDGALLLLEQGALKGQVGKVFVIGGAELFRIAIEHPSCDELLVTRIDAVFSCDTFFPSIPPAFARLSLSDFQNEKDLSYRYELYRKM